MYRPEEDCALAEVVAELRSLDPDGDLTAEVFRSTFDQLYDGQHTGRYCIDQLFKTEKTHFGTLIEINLQRRFHYEDGEVLDFKIAGHEVDCKFSHTKNWMIPMECFDQLAMVTWADDATARWGVGVVRAVEEHRRLGANRDRKSSINAQGKNAVVWVHYNQPMSPNVFLEIPRERADFIFGLESGQLRVDELFRSACNRRLTRNAVATVAQQADYMKRVRANGGARTNLRDEGIIILSGDFNAQKRIAQDLGIEVPGPGELISTRVCPADEGVGAKIDGGWWRLALDGEDAIVTAPKV